MKLRTGRLLRKVRSRTVKRRYLKCNLYKTPSADRGSNQNLCKHVPGTSRLEIPQHNSCAADSVIAVFSVFRSRPAREAYPPWITPGGAAVYSEAFISALRQAPWPLRAAAAGLQSSSLTPVRVRKRSTLWHVHTSRSLGSSWRSGVFPTAKVAIAYSIQAVTSTFCTVRVCSHAAVY